RVDVGGAHVGGDGLDLGPGPPQPPPEGRQGVPALAPADMDHRPALQIQHDGQVAVPPADGDFVDGELPEVLQLGAAEAAGQVLLLDLLDEVPTDPAVGGNVLDGNEPAQLQPAAR